MGRIMILCISLLVTNTAWAHFQMLIPADDIVEQKENKLLKLSYLFWHPFEGIGMNMSMPTQAGVRSGGKNHDLLPVMKAAITKDKHQKPFNTWSAEYSLKNPGDYVFYVEPKPYFEETESIFIVHYTKVVANAFGLTEGWQEEVGLKAEIVPLTRPYGLYKGNVFQGMVKFQGKTVPYCEIEVEFYNQNGKQKVPNDIMMTQVIRTDGNGVFSPMGFPKRGGGVFAATNSRKRICNASWRVGIPG